MEYVRIVLRSLSTPVFVIMLFLASVLLFLGEKQDAFFVMAVVSFNLLLGIIQEIRSRSILHKLELMNQPVARLIRDGQEISVNYQGLRRGNLISLRAGDEVPADVKLTKAKGLECDESILTGESKPVKKRAGDILYATSVITAGTAEAVVEAVGDETETGKMSAKLKSYDPQLSPLQQSISRAIQYLTIVAVVVGVVFLVVYKNRSIGLIKTVETITTAVINIVPEGLLLASTVFLAYGSLRLSKAQVLPQKLSAIENLALVDVLCLDKTGTLTSSKINLNSFESWLDGVDLSERDLKKIVALLAYEAGSNNSTSRAILASLSRPLGINYHIRQILSFSSDRKVSAIRLRYRLRELAVVMGAPENVEAIAPSSPDMNKRVAELQSTGLRVMQVALLPQEVGLDDISLGSGQSVALISFSNDLRPGVKETIAFMQDQDISVRVISGDNPQTVSFIANKAGIKQADRAITGGQLAKLEGKAWDKAILEHTIFARVLPDQKEKIISSYRRQGFYTAMVGDGINDALALKAADLGIAMNAGSSASKRVSDIILLQNAFTALPMGMKVGNRIMLAIEMIAALAFHKVIFGLVISLLSLLLGVPYPFAPRHITFINIFLITLPTLIITIFSPQPTYKINPRKFWRHTLLDIIPIAVLSGLGIFGVYWLMVLLSPIGATGQATVTVLAATFFGIHMVFLVNYIFKTKQTKQTRLATLTYVAVSAIVAIATFSFDFTRVFFEFYKPEGLGIILSIILVGVITHFQRRIARRIRLKRV